MSYQIPTSSYITSSPTAGGDMTKVLGTFSAVSTGLNLLKSIVPVDIYEKTFAAVFKNGFNLKCWGASWNPDKARNVLEAELPRLINVAQNVIIGDSSKFISGVNNWLVSFYATRAPERDWLQTTAKDCTKDGLRILVGGLDASKIDVKEAFNIRAAELGYKLVGTTSITKTFPPNKAGAHKLTQKIEQYRLVKVASTATSTTVKQSLVGDPVNTGDAPKAAPKSSNLLLTVALGWAVTKLFK